MTMGFPTEWTDKIFDKLTVRYGREFLARWEGVDIAQVKTDWCSTMEGFENWPAAIAHGLESLPEKPPTATTFRDLCRKAPKPLALAYDAPKANPSVMAAALASARPTAKATTFGDHKAWARTHLRNNTISGFTVRPIALRFSREALNLPASGEGDRAYLASLAVN